MQTVAISYGIFGGDITAKRLRKALNQAGYKLTSNLSDADIIIGHSAGCYWLDQADPKQKLLPINPPHWPGKTVGQRARVRARQNFLFRRQGIRTAEWLPRQLLGMYYGMRDGRRAWRIVRYSSQYSLLDTLNSHADVLIVRNDADMWLVPGLEALQKQYPKLIIRTLPGDHDDCLYHPETYVHLLQLLL
jgi:hypothetical protein